MKPTETKYTLEVTTPSEREIVMTRVLAAPRTLVFEAFTQPELIKRWLLGPDGWWMPVCDVDLRVGGSFRYEWRSDERDVQFGISGVYREIVRPERLVHIESMDGQPGRATITTTFAERDGLTTVTMTNLYDSAEIRDIALESGMDGGVAASYDRLEQVLATR
jgi:uncharacterized protein YndB with AHSA1/START domain